jgi:NRAMP (natural resistance-associated macrophage protein)-like metal ion transporter
MNQKALSAKLGCVTGMDLAQMNRAYLPRWLNWGLYAMAEAAIICTDIGQVSSLPRYLNTKCCTNNISGHWNRYCT